MSKATPAQCAAFMVDVLVKEGYLRQLAVKEALRRTQSAQQRSPDLDFWKEVREQLLALIPVRVYSDTLHLTLNKKWFDMIREGRKVIEYREIKKYWGDRLLDGVGEFIPYKFVIARNGYAKDAPTMIWEVDYIDTGMPVLGWVPAEDKGREFFRIHIKNVIQ
jgi:hypothetical protein